MDRTKLQILEFMEALQLLIQKMKVEPGSSTLMFPVSANVDYGLIDPNFISQKRLTEHACCILSGRAGTMELDANKNIDRIEISIPVVAFFKFDSVTYTGKQMIEYEYHYIQQMIDLFQNEINNWDEFITVNVASFDMDAQIGPLDPWFWDTNILPPYYACVVTLSVTIEGSNL